MLAGAAKKSTCNGSHRGEEAGMHALELCKQVAHTWYLKRKIFRFSLGDSLQAPASKHWHGFLFWNTSTETCLVAEDMYPCAGQEICLVAEGILGSATQVETSNSHMYAVTSCCFPN